MVRREAETEALGDPTTHLRVVLTAVLKCGGKLAQRHGWDVRAPWKVVAGPGERTQQREDTSSDAIYASVIVRSSSGCLLWRVELVPGVGALGDAVSFSLLCSHYLSISTMNQEHTANVLVENWKRC